MRCCSFDEEDVQVGGWMAYCIGSVELDDNVAGMELTGSDSRRKLKIPRVLG